MRKDLILSFLLFGIFLLPKNVFATTSVEVNITDSSFNAVTEGAHVSPVVKELWNNKNYLFGLDSVEHWGKALMIAYAQFPFQIVSNIDLKKYDSFLISTYGSPIFQAQIQTTTCTVSNSTSIVRNNEAIVITTYQCPVSEIINNTILFNTYFTNTIYATLNFPNHFTFIEKGATNNDITGAIQNQTTEITNSIDNIKDMDMNESDKELPDNSSYQDYAGSQDELLEKAKDVDLNILDVGLDVQSSSWVWDTLSRLIQSNSVVFGLFIGILSIGIIKLILGR